MGSRGNIVVHVPRGGRLYLYTHRRGAELPSRLAEGLRRAERAGRWRDAGYLAWILLAALTEGDERSDLGYTVSTQRTLPDLDELHVDAGAQEVRRVTFAFDGGDFRERVIEEWSFAQFLRAAPGVALEPPTDEEGLLRPGA